MSFSNIFKGYFNWFKYMVYKPYREKQRNLFSYRLQVCEKCNHFTKTRQCDLCSCFMDAKTKVIFELDENGKSIDGCWEEKW